MRKELFYLIIFFLAIGGCQEDAVDFPYFDVFAKDSTDVVVKVKEPINFEFEGNPDMLYFYSGETGKRYEYAGRVSAKGTPYLQFNSYRANGKQEGSLRLMISQDFPGITVGTDSISKAATIKKISEATWTDITDRALLSSGTTMNSGAIDLSDFAQAGKPVFIAFKYLAQAGSIQNKWTISALTVKNTLPDGTVYTLANTTNTAITNYGVATVFSPGWVFFPVINTYSWGLSSNNLIITGATSVSSATDMSEAWAIMGPVDLTKVTPDVGLFLKGLDTRLGNYSYTYNVAGTYTATFIGVADNVYGKKELVKQVKIKVNP